MRKLIGTISVAPIAAAFMAAPSGASGATTIGQTFTPTNTCSANITHLQTTSPGSSYAAPQDGVITTWTFQAANSPPQLKLKVGRAAGGTSYMIVGQSDLQTPGPNTLTTYPTRIPVQAGDMIGFYSQTLGPCFSLPGASGYSFHHTLGDIAPGTTTTFSTGGTVQFDLAAQLEPDCDKDGFGDETQDNNTASCRTSALTCKGQQATVIGTSGNDVRSGTPGRDVMVGLAGSDKLSGLAGNDLICGGSGKDNLSGGKGNDKLYGQKGKDKLRGKAGEDLCVGGPGKDTAKGCEKTKSI